MPTFKKILVPVDFSGPSAEALSYACAIAEKFDAELLVLHVLGAPQSSGMTAIRRVGAAEREEAAEKLRVKAEAELAEFCAAECSDFPATQLATHLVWGGDPADEILEFAKDRDVDLIVMGSAKKKLTGLVLGSSSKKVVSKSRWPVLTIRPSK